MTDRKSKRPSGRETLLTACDRLFPDAGYSRVSVADILGESGLKAPSLYHHFGDKEGLYLAWVRAALERVGGRLEAAVVASRPGCALSELARVVASPEFPDILEMLRDRACLSEAGRAEVGVEVGRHVYRWFERALEARGEPPSELRVTMAVFLANAMAASRPRYVGGEGVACPIDLLSRALLGDGSGTGAHRASGLSLGPHGPAE